VTAPWTPPTLRAEPCEVTLTAQQANVLAGMCCGHSNATIGARLHITEDSVKTVARRLFVKLGARSRAHAVALACSGQVTVLVAVEAKVSGPVEPPDLLSVAQVATRLKVSKMTVLRLIESRQLRARRVHRWWQIEVPDVQKFLAANRTDREVS
jgi:excisionase family DNA binding protein